MRIKELLTKRRQGFGGITHVLLAITLFFILLMFPMEYFEDFLTLARSSLLYFFIFLFILSGAALLPDLDNDESTAGYQLGIIGSVIKTFMKTTAYIVYSFYNLSGDKPPKSMHRLFWHTPFVAFLLIGYYVYFTPQGDMSYWSMLVTSWKEKDFVNLLMNHTGTTFTVVLAYVSGKLGSNVLLYWVLKLLPFGGRIKGLINTIMPIGILVYIVTIPISDLKYVGIAVGLGYLFHILGDLITQGSVPAHWPIPWKKQAWHAPWVLGPLQIRTGGIVNTLLNFVFLAVNIILAIKLFR